MNQYSGQDHGFLTFLFEMLINIMGSEYLLETSVSQVLLFLKVKYGAKTSFALIIC